MYRWCGMRKINYEIALRYFKFSNTEVFRLYDDGTEGLVQTEGEMKEHNEQGGEFGVEREAVE